MSSDRSPADPLIEPIVWDGSLVDLFRSAARGRHPFLLLSGTARSGRGRWSILGSDPFQVWSSRGAEDPFTAAGRLAAAHPALPAARLPFAGGLVGYLGYESLRHVERVPVRALDPGDPPMAWFGLYASAVVVDGRSGKGWLVATGLPETDPARRAARARDDLERLRERIRSPIRRRHRELPEPGPLSSSLPRADYLEAVRRILDHIRAGDVYQANLTQRFEAPLEVVDPVDLLGRLHSASPAPHAAYLDIGEWRILSASPERFLRRQGKRVESRPIKGTAPRGRTPEEDAVLREALEASPKDRAENVMIVDLVRNDLNRVCRPGSVRVPSLARVESNATVHHLVSTVEGELRQGRATEDLIRAAFPPGSMTGAPKVRAMEILHDLEPVPRGPYAGGLGYVSFAGDLDLSVVIRTVLLGRGHARFHVGGGVVADSDPAREYEESLWKARALMQALGFGEG